VLSLVIGGKSGVQSPPSIEQLVRTAVAVSTNVLFQGALRVIKLLVGLRDI
jgi:hypothetical protein